jgi:hypothetical protein
MQYAMTLEPDRVIIKLLKWLNNIKLLLQHFFYINDGIKVKNIILTKTN